MKPESILKVLTKLDLANWTTTFWLVKRATAEHKATYSVIRVDTDKKLQARFKEYLEVQLTSRHLILEEYDFTNADTEDVLLTIPADATDFPKVQGSIADGFDNAHATEYRDLLDSWAYVIQFENGKETLYAWRKINAMTQPRKVKSRKALLFRNQRLTDLEEEEVFLIDPRFDFFVYKDTVFIANKREFESSMNFREGLKDEATALFSTLQSLKFFSDVALIRTFVGDNLRHLRKLAAIKKAGYYDQPEYLKRLKAVSSKEGWDLQFDGDQIIVTAENIELLLKLLNNDRLRSPINDETFDSAAKTKVPNARGSA